VSATSPDLPPPAHPTPTPKTARGQYENQLRAAAERVQNHVPVQPEHPGHGTDPLPLEIRFGTRYDPELRADRSAWTVRFVLALTATGRTRRWGQVQRRSQQRTHNRDVQGHEEDPMTAHQPEAPFDPGGRIELVYTDDEHTALVPGDQGTVTGWNAALGQLGVRWDNGSTLAMLLVPGGDQIGPAPPTLVPPGGDGPAPPGPDPARRPTAGPHGPAAPDRPHHPGAAAAPDSGPDSGPNSGTAVRPAVPPGGPGGRPAAGGPGGGSPGGLVLPDTLAARPVCPRRGLPIPYVHTPGPDGFIDFTSIDPRRVAQVGMARACSLCATPMGYWLAFIGGPRAAAERAYTDPPMYLAPRWRWLCVRT
jgi:Domain of unknown function (DUF4314)